VEREMDDFHVIMGHGPVETLTSLSSRPVVTPQRVCIDMGDERIQDMLNRVQRAVVNKYPDAEFVSYIGTNPLGIYIEIYTTQDSFLGILGLINEKFDNLHISAGVDVCVLPKRKVQTQAA
jgi:hypothetical protein